jgi:hypothetical protein
VTGTDRSDATVERFAPNGGTLIAVLGGLLSVGFVLGWLFDMDGVPLWVPAVALLGGVVTYTSTVRPRVSVERQELVLRNMLSTVRLPLAAIEEVAVQQVMAVRAGGRRYVCAGVGRSLRQAMKGTSMQRAREHMGGLTGHLAAVVEPGMNYADFVEIRVQELVNDDRVRRGVARYSPEADALAEQVRRDPAWLEIGALIATAVLFVIAVLVA